MFELSVELFDSNKTIQNHTKINKFHVGKTMQSKRNKAEQQTISGTHKITKKCGHVTVPEICANPHKPCGATITRHKKED